MSGPLLTLGDLQKKLTEEVRTNGADARKAIVSIEFVGPNRRSFYDAKATAFTGLRYSPDGMAVVSLRIEPADKSDSENG